MKSALLHEHPETRLDKSLATWWSILCLITVDHGVERLGIGKKSWGFLSPKGIPDRGAALVTQFPGCVLLLSEYGQLLIPYSCDDYGC